MSNSFSLAGRVAVVTGGYGVLGGSMANGLARAGARVAILGRNAAHAEAKVLELRNAGHDAMTLVADVLDVDSLTAAREQLLAAWGRVDILLNTAGGNVARARTDRTTVFALPFDAFDEAVRLNLHGTVYPSLIFGEAMARPGAEARGSIVNISSMAALQAISGVMAYSVAKAAIDNFTRWMAVDLAKRCGPGLRVNAIAPGFFVSTQNRAVLIEPDGSPTERARTILEQTPMGRFGEAHEVDGIMQFLCSDAASFITGTVIPVDGGFSAFSGV
ncbi:MAG: SDR family oxidoreductase [Gemmatimonadaceae bacterium]|nr:SDR family oxidoreductase [Gemmatimonadaceae bacterium]